MPITLNGDTGITTPSYGGAVAAEYLVPVTGFKNRIINGAMTIDQRNAGASLTITSDGAYTLDRWITRSSASSKFSVQQNAGSVTPPSGFRNYLGATSLSSYSVGAGEIFGVGQRIEGFNVADLGWGTASAATITVSFWVRSSLTGTFGGSVYNSATTRSYPFTFTVSSANTWEQKSITVAGDTAGTWLTTNGNGLELFFSLGTGSTYTGTAGAWASADYKTATGATSVVGTNGATFYITGVQLEKGSTATSFDYRPYGTELQLCQRYYYRLLGNSLYEGIGNGYAISYSSTQCQGPFVMPVKLRTSPSISYSSNLKVSDVYSYSRAVSSISVSSVNNGTDCAYLDIVSSSLSTGRVHYLGADNSTSSFVAFVAEL